MPSFSEPDDVSGRRGSLWSHRFSSTKTPTATTTATTTSGTDSSIDSQYAPNRTTSPVSFRDSSSSWASPYVVPESETGKSTSKLWDNQYILTLDGGGLRGYSSLLILEELMRRISEVERNEDIPAKSSEESPLYRSDGGSDRETGYHRSFRPCHYFDVVCGTGMGGLSAVMVGRLRYTAEEARVNFESILDNMQTRKPRFGTARKSRTNNTSRLRSAILRTLSSSKHQRISESTPFSQDDRLCKAAVLTMLIDRNEGLNHPVLLRSYGSREFNVGTKVRRNSEVSASDTPLIEACMASMAAPSYFRSVRINGQKYRDGSTWNMDPGMEMYREVSSNAQKPVGCIISIGYDPIRPSDRLQKKVPEVLESRRLQSRQQFYYDRLSCPNPLPDSSKDDWRIDLDVEKTLHRIGENTSVWIRSHRKKIMLAAEELVHNRRKRCRTPGWETYASGVAYRCDICLRESVPVRELDHDSMVTHILSVHGRDKPLSDSQAIVGDRNLNHLEGILAASRTYVDAF